MAPGDWVGETLSGRYKIVEMIGQGGMSAVYKAMDPNLRRTVAIKVIHSHLATDPGFVSRFEDEASAVAQLRHPNIVQVFDFNHDGNTYYMVMEYIPGETLQARLLRLNGQNRRLSLEEIVDIGSSVASAADYAHKRNLIHRDIKPANVLLSVYGQAILMDFGIAKITGGQHHTATGAVVGTALYMSPEQIKGEGLDARSDIYSLGVMLYEMASGQPPFQADSAMTLMMMHLNDPVPDLRKLVPEVNPRLVAIINKALAKKPQDRFQTAQELGSSLNDLLKTAAAGEVATVVDREPEEPPQNQIKATIVEPRADLKPPFQETRPPVVSPAASVDLSTAKAVSTGAAASSAGALEINSASPPPTIPPASTQTRHTPPPGMSAINRPATTSPYLFQPVVPPPPAGAVKKKSGPGLWIIAGLVMVLLLGCLLTGGVLAARGYIGNFALGGRGSDGGNPEATLTIEPTTTSDVVVVGDVSTETLTTVLPSTEAYSPAATTPAPVNAASPTTPAGPYVRINKITIENGVYVVDYETFGYTEKLPGMHVHFFYNTVTPENAGIPGTGPWILYGGPRPFKGYRISEKPAAATQMCALVANPDHSVQLNTGNCVDLP